LFKNHSVTPVSFVVVTQLLCKKLKSTFYIAMPMPKKQKTAIFLTLNILFLKLNHACKYYLQANMFQ